MKNLIHNAEPQKFSETIKLETCFSEEQKHIWNNMIKIEKIKKENTLQKHSVLRRTARMTNA